MSGQRAAVDLDAASRQDFLDAVKRRMVGEA
jgi:hypothetical protein